MDRLLQEITDRVCALQFADLPASVAHECRRRIIDTLGCGIAAFDCEPARMARALAQRADVRSGATVLGTGHRTLPELAAFANGVMTRYLDGNDCYPGGGGHPSDAIPALLAVAEATGTDPRIAMAAIVAGYDAHYRLFHGFRVFGRGFDHVAYSAIAAAAGAAKVLGLDRDKTAAAISLAATANLSLGVTRRGSLSMWKGCAGPNAARNGVFAALAAQTGMTGPDRPFEGDHGWQELVRPFDAAAASAVPFPILQADTKYLLSEYHAQGPIMAALQLRREIEVENIVAVAIHTYTFAYKEIGSGREKWRPTTRETADHSLPYIVAAVLVDGQFSDAIFAAARFSDPRILALIDLITVHEDPELCRQFPRAFPCRVEIIAKDGTRRIAAIANPRGHHDDPMTDDEVGAKFRELAARKLPAGQVERALHLLWRLGEGPSVGEVMAALRVSGQP